MTIINNDMCDPLDLDLATLYLWCCPANISLQKWLRQTTECSKQLEDLNIGQICSIERLKYWSDLFYW